MQANLDEKIIYRQPTTNGERTEVAAACQIGMDLKMPYYIDGIDNGVEEKYLSLPMRLYLVGADGKIAYTGDRGPFGFNMDTWVEAIEEQLGG